MTLINYTIILLLALIPLIVLINKIKPLPYIKISFFLIMVSVLLFFGRNLLPEYFRLPVNTFEISFKNPYGFECYHTSTCDLNFSKRQGDSYRLVALSDNRDFEVDINGVFIFTKHVEKTFNFFLRNAKAELIINSKLFAISVGDRFTEKSMKYEFSPGVYLVKIKIKNISGYRYHNINFFMDDYHPVKSDEEVKNILKPIVNKDTNIYYTFGLVKKNIILKPSKKQTVLFLSAGIIPTYWKIDNCKKAKLKAVVFDGTGVRIDTECGDVLKLRVKDLPAVKKIPSVSDCTYYAPLGMMCKGYIFKKFFNLIKKTEYYTRKSLTGFSPDIYSYFDKVQTAVMPSIILNKQKIENIALIKERIKQKEKTINKLKEEPFYKSGKKLWSEIFKINEEQIPLNKFKAFYMSMNHPRKILYSETVEYPDILYSNSKFHGIRPDDFLGLWIGDFVFDKDTLKNLPLYVSWAKVKLYIDEKLVYEGKDSALIPYKFKKGKHRIEIEYVNNYGQVDFYFNILEKAVEINNGFKKLITPETEIYLVGVYGGNNKHVFNVITKNSKNKKIILFLSSYKPTRWNIVNDKNVKAVVYNSYYPGSFVKVKNREIKIYHDKNLPYVTRIIPYCYKKGECEDKEEFTNVLKHIVELTGRRPDGFSSVYEPSFGSKGLKRVFKSEYIFVPQIILNEKVYREIDEIMQRLN